MTLKLNDIRIDCVIGERADERTRLQPLSVWVALELPDSAAHTDELSETVDYAALAEEIRSVLVAAKCQLIERAAALVAETCFRDARVSRVKVSVVKRGAVTGLDSAEAEYELGR